MSYGCSRHGQGRTVHWSDEVGSRYMPAAPEAPNTSRFTSHRLALRWNNMYQNLDRARRYQAQRGTGPYDWSTNRDNRMRAWEFEDIGDRNAYGGYGYDPRSTGYGCFGGGGGYGGYGGRGGCH